MLRREIVIGFVAAGFAAAAVPASFWSAVFLRGHGTLTLIENALVGPFVAIISFVCSVGNVPLAAALWQDGISFGGVVAFVFADLISLPLLVIYRKLYGGRLTLRLLGIFWLVMSAAGLLTELIANAVGLVPAARPAIIAPEHLSWNYTTILNIVFRVVLAGIYWLHRSKERLGGGRDVARDPVCGMQVDTANPGAVLRAGGHTTYFCSGHCRDRYRPDPAQAAGAQPGSTGAASTGAASALPARIRDLGAAGPLRDRDHSGGTAPFPAAVTTAC